MNDPYSETLNAIYGQLHEHVREAGKKRDQVIAFYLLVLVALFSGWDKIAPIREVVLTMVWIAGLFSFLIVIRYRSWHVLHGAAMVTLQRLMVEETPPTLKRCEEVWSWTNDTPGVWTLMSPMRGVESGMIWLFAFLTLIPGYLLLDGSKVRLLAAESDAAALLTNAVLYVPALVAIAAAYVRKFHRFQKDIWAFRWLRDEPGSTQPKEALLLGGQDTEASGSVGSPAAMINDAP